MKNKVIKVEGMMCEHCEQRVVEALNKMKGILASSAYAKEKTVHVSFDEGIVKDSDIIEAIESIGYDVV